MAERKADFDTQGDFATFEDGVYSYSKRGPEKKSPVRDDPLQDILETLYSEHRYISSLLDTLEWQAARLKPGKVPDYHLLHDIVDYLTHYPDVYHHPREDLLFASMLKQDKGFRERLDRLQREHQALQHYNRELLGELSQITEGRRVDRPGLLQRIKRYTAGYRQHIDYESSEIFPQAKGHLSTRDLEKLSEKTRYINDPLFGGDIQRQYRRLERSLQGRVEVLGQGLIAREMSGIEATIENLSALVDTLGELRAAIGGQIREARQEQLATLREHTCPGDGPNIVRLPLALAINHQRFLGEGFAEISGIFGRSRIRKKPVAGNGNATSESQRRSPGR